MKQEQYIPFDKDFLLEQHIAENIFDKKEADQFKKLFEILEHYFHYDAFNLTQQLKRNFAAFDPDKTKEERLKAVQKSNLSVFKNSLHEVLERGNYNRIEQHVLEAALNDSDLVGLQLNINFDDFKEYAVFVRGTHKATETIPKFIFWKKEVEIEYYDRAIIYIQYNDERYFENKKVNSNNLAFAPGCVILKVFKRVPKNDLETIFPNAVPKMSIKDKLLLWVPGVVGGISLLSTKVIPPLLVMYAAYKSGEILDLSKSKTSLTQGLIALGVLGAYLFRQYNDYLNKKIKFSKLLSDSLYFKNLGNNSGIFPLLIDVSEEEELKETILAYTFLNKSKQPLTAEELDGQIEQWFKDKFQITIDFDVEDALRKLKNIGLGTETDGKWTVLPLEKSLARVDEIWDSIFDYNN